MTTTPTRQGSLPSPRSADGVDTAQPATATTAAALMGSRDRKPSAHARDIPACERCRTLKKKCSRTFPVCTLCASARQTCSFSTPATSSAAEAHHLRARVDWLTRYVNKGIPVGTSGVESIDTGSDLDAILSHLPLGLSTTGARNTRNIPGTASVGQDAFTTAAGTGAVLFDQPAVVTTNQDTESITPRDYMHVSALLRPADEVPLAKSTSGSNQAGRLEPQAPPSDALARRFVDAYFRNVNRAYPFVDRAKVLRNLDSIRNIPENRRDAGSTLMYLVMAIGCTTLQRAGQIYGDTIAKFDIVYADIVQECLLRQDIESVQILLLLALYSLFDPNGASAWAMVGIASRQALLLGLSRRVSEDKSLSPADIELRHRLFWSLYVFDRMMAVSLGLSVALADDNLDVSLPSLTVEEFASAEKPYFASILQTNRHVIQLRQIEDRILREIHLRKDSEVATISHADRRAILQDIRTAIEGWYSTGCLLSPLEADNLPIHNSVIWQSARYYHLLILLYYPCQFNSFMPVSSSELLRFAQKELQSTTVLLQQQQLPLNKVTLCRVLQIGLVLLHGFISFAGNGTSFPARDEVALVITILEAFPEGWMQAHQAAHIFHQFMAIVSGVSGNGSFQFSAPLYGRFELGMSKELYKAMLRPVVTGLLALMREVLGPATCFCFQELPDERNHIDASVKDPGYEPASMSPMGAARSSVPFTGVSSSDESSLNYDWGSGELGFI